MLTSLQIRDYAIVDQIAVEFDPGMTVLTGETGAGKSILVDAVGLLPRFRIEPDPLYASMFVANLGSVNLEGGFHHLWEHGTCSTFCVMGAIRPGPGDRRVMTVFYTYDERVEDGLYASISIADVRKRLQNPELLLATTEELGRRP